MYSIRPYEPRDRERMREICTVTAPPRVYEDADFRAWIVLMYSDYYTACEPKTCFVAANDEDEAVGYIICAPNWRRYRVRFFLRFLWRIRRHSKQAAKNWLANRKDERALARDYPAHLHIDIFPEAQRAGLGHRLMDALTAELRARGVPGVMLGCSKSNVKGNSFYRKYGFSVLKESELTVTYGLSLRD